MKSLRSLSFWAEARISSVGFLGLVFLTITGLTFVAGGIDILFNNSSLLHWAAFTAMLCIMTATVLITDYKSRKTAFSSETFLKQLRENRTASISEPNGALAIAWLIDYSDKTWVVVASSKGGSGNHGLPYIFCPLETLEKRLLSPSSDQPTWKLLQDFGVYENLRELHYGHLSKLVSASAAED